MGAGFFWLLVKKKRGRGKSENFRAVIKEVRITGMSVEARSVAGWMCVATGGCRVLLSVDCEPWLMDLLNVETRNRGNSRGDNKKQTKVCTYIRSMGPVLLHPECRVVRCPAHTCSFEGHDPRS